MYFAWRKDLWTDIKTCVLGLCPFPISKIGHKNASHPTSWFAMWLLLDLIYYEVCFFSAGMTLVPIWPIVHSRSDFMKLSSLNLKKSTVYIFTTWKPVTLYEDLLSWQHHAVKKPKLATRKKSSHLEEPWETSDAREVFLDPLVQHSRQLTVTVWMTFVQNKTSVPQILTHILIRR